MPNETVSDLLPNTSYVFWVNASNSAGTGPDSVFLTVKTKQAVDPFSDEFSVDFGQGA